MDPGPIDRLHTLLESKGEDGERLTSTLVSRLKDSPHLTNYLSGLIDAVHDKVAEETRPGHAVTGTLKNDLGRPLQ